MSGVKKVLVVVGVCTVFAAIPLFGVGIDRWTATKAESYAVTGAVAVRRGGEAYVTVSGYAERVSETNNRGQRRTQTSAFPRLTTYRVSDGAPVARRQYSELFPRLTYVDTTVHALAASADRVWVLSSDRGVALHAVDPVTLADVIDRGALAARLPALASGVFMEAGASQSSVTLVGRELVFRANSGAWLALDPATVSARALAADGHDAEEVVRAGSPRGNLAVERAVANRTEWLEPVVVPVSDADGAPDAGVSYVVTRSSLDREAARVRVTRWDTTGPTPVAGWTRALDTVPPECCQRHVWRHQGAAVLWYEHWLLALDDATGAPRWIRRL